MLALNKLILVVGLISSGYLSSMEALPTGLSKMEAAVKFVDDYLTKHAKSDDIEGNIRAARQLKREVSDSDLEEDSEETQNERISRVAGGVAYLDEIFEGENKCNEFSYFALFNINLYTKGGLENENSTSRVAMIGRHYVKRHAEVCGRDYESRLEAAMKNVDPFLMERVDAYLGVDITSVQPPLEYIIRGIDSEQELQFIIAPEAAQQAYDALKKVTQNYPADSQLLTGPGQADKVKDLYNRYFESACADLYQEIADIALPAVFDNEVVTHGELPEIYKKFIECEARRPFDYSGLTEEIAKIVGQ